MRELIGSTTHKKNQTSIYNIYKMTGVEQNDTHLRVLKGVYIDIICNTLGIFMKISSVGGLMGCTTHKKWLIRIIVN